MDRETYRERYVPHAADSTALDEILPDDAVLFVPWRRMGSIYLPRPPIFAAADLPTDRPVYLFLVGEDGSDRFDAPDGFSEAEEVYATDASLWMITRMPGSPNESQPLRVVRLVRDP